MWSSESWFSFAFLKALKNSNGTVAIPEVGLLSVAWAPGLTACCADLLHHIQPMRYAGTVPCQYDFQSLSNFFTTTQSSASVRARLGKCHCFSASLHAELGLQRIIGR